LAIEQQHAPRLIEMAEEALYIEWKRYGRHIEEYASEFVGTAFHILALVAVVGIMFGPLSPIVHAIPSQGLRLFLAGLMIGGSGALVAISPLGRLSGGHINPAISLGFWMQGRMHSRDLIGYVVSQMAGGALGVAAAALLIPGLAKSVSYAVLIPSKGLGDWATFGLEVAATFILATVVFSFVASKRFMRYTPAAVPVTAGFLVWWDGALSGAGLNPARWFGPAVSMSEWHLGWAYVLGPVTGSVLAALIRLHPNLIPHRPKTCKIYHDSRFRSIFKHEAVASSPPKHICETIER
jgi:aquaporin Z